MQLNQRWMLAALIVSGLLLAACSGTSARTPKAGPATIEQIDGTDLSRVTLTAEATERLGIQTAPVSEVEVARAGGEPALRKVIPYAAVMYRSNGDTYVYTNLEPLVFVRAPISVDYIEGDQAVLADGPPTGTAVVTAGAPELYGTEFKVGK